MVTKIGDIVSEMTRNNLKATPCEQCIVQPMCKEGCDKLERFLYEKLHSIYSSPLDTYFYLENDLKKGTVRMEISDNNKVKFYNIRGEKV